MKNSLSEKSSLDLRPVYAKVVELQVSNDSILSPPLLKCAVHGRPVVCEKDAAFSSFNKEAAFYYCSST